MEIISKCAAVAIVASCAALLIKKSNPEFSLALGILMAGIIMAGAITALSVAEDLVSCARDMLGASSTLIRPMMKCVGISFVTKFSADICREASQPAAASAMELAGCACSAAVSMPLVISMMKMIGTMV